MAVSPWINEFHYDNTGTDAGELIEIAAPAGTDLTGYSLVLYNGDSASRSTYNTLALAGTVPNQQNGFGTLGFSYPVNGIQNGSPDGIALVQGITVVQFLSYEGSFTAANGPAAGQTSTDIGVSEPGDVTGQSLQLTGTGTQYGDFTWHTQQAQTAGAVNTGQTFTDATTVSIADASIAEGDTGDKVLAFTVTRSQNTGAFAVDFTTTDDSATSPADYAAVTGAPNTLTFEAGGALAQQVSITIHGDTSQEPDERFTVSLGNLVNAAGQAVIGNGSATGTILNDDVTLTRIYDIQGSNSTSPLAGQSVTTQGVVTGRASNGFYIQDAAGDGNAATSDGIFVFTSSAPPATAAVGSLVNVTGTVQEFVASDAAPGSLPVTEIAGTPTITVLSSGNALPASVVIGTGGLTPPSSDLNAGAAFFEALEGMRVMALSPLVTGPTNGFGEIFTVGSGGTGATGLNSRGDLLLSGGAPSFGNTDTVGGDFNPERIQIDDGLGQSTPDVSVGARLADVTGIVNYSFGNYEVLATSAVTVTTPSPLVKTGATLTGDTSHLLVASYNAENLDPGDGAARFATIASEIVGKLNAPDVIALQEVQDNNGAAGGTGSTVTSASQTLQLLVDAVTAAGGPQYALIDNPFIGANTNGGEPGGNIRTAFLYRTDHVDLVGGSLRTIGADGSAISSGPDTTQQTDPNNPFFASRPPLAADFLFDGQIVTLVNNHFTSKGGSGALLGSVQPPFDAGEVQRAAQAQAVNNFVDSVLASNANARVIVTGDLNDFEFEQPLSVLKGVASISDYTANGSDPFNATATYIPGGVAVLRDLQDLLPVDQRFDYVFEGSAQTLDHMLVSNALLAGARFEPVHINSEFFDQTSDHDPLVGLFSFTSATAAFSVAENQTAVGTVLAGDPQHDAFSYALSGGDDTSFFRIDAVSGALSFRNTPDFETPQDANRDNAYNVVVSMTDALDAVRTQTITVDVTDVAEAGRTISGGNGANVLPGTTGPDTIGGGNGNDTIDAGDGDDTVSGGNGNDTILAGRGNDVVDGGNGNDSLSGGLGIDRLSGGNGNDTIDGGLEADILSGGNGRDAFVYRSVSDAGASGDVINGFARGAGGDVLNLHELLDTFTGIASGAHANAFSGGYLQFLQSGSNTLVQVDSNGAGDAYVTLATLTNTLLQQTDTSNYML